MAACVTITKVLLIIFNVIIFVIALLQAAIAAFFLIAAEFADDDKEKVANETGKSEDEVDLGIMVARGAGIYFIIVACITAFVAILGCCGAYRGNVCKLITYAVIIGVFLLLQIIGIVWGVIAGDKSASQGLKEFGTGIVTVLIMVACMLMASYLAHTYRKTPMVTEEGHPLQHKA